MMIRVPNAAGSEMSAYMALPRKGRGAGLVVIQEIFGVTESMKKVCDFFAARQFTAICPDLYWSVEPGVQIPETDVEKARGLRGKVNDDKISDDIAAAAAFLRKHDACTGAVGVVGYCWGGLLAYITAARHDVDAAVAYYGVGIENRLELASKVKCPMLMHFGAKDPYVSGESLNKIKAALKGDSRVTIETYAEGGHAFARPGGGHYHHASADLADMRSLSFLVEKLIGHR
jgi:carboxymethylenebutenolidase